MSRCRKLTPKEQEQWDNIQALSPNERVDKELAFIKSIMEPAKQTESKTFPRESLQSQEEELTPEQKKILEDKFMGGRVIGVRPRQMDWEDEIANTEEVIRTNPTIRDHIWTPKEVNGFKELAESAWRQDSKKAKKAALKQAGLKQKLFVKSWEELSIKERNALIVSLIPDNSLTMGRGHEFFDMEYYMQFLEEQTGLPFLTMLRRIEGAGAVAETRKEIILRDITSNPRFVKIRTDSNALARVAQEINARNEQSNIEHPENISEDEMFMADSIQDIYKEYEPIVRYLRVMRTNSTLKDFKKEFPDAVKEGKELELAWALELKNTGRLDDLWDYLQTLEWGVIGSGFDPRMISDASIKPVKISINTARGESRLERRVAVDFPEDKMTKNVLQRLATYIEQMEIQWLIDEDLNNLEELWDSVAPKYTNREEIKGGLKKWLARVQGIPLDYGWWDRQLRKIWLQSMKSVFIAPNLSLRNLAQAALLHPDRTWLVKSLTTKIDPVTKEKAKLFFDTYVSQLGGLRHDWLQQGEQTWQFMNPINKLADKAVMLYDWSDYAPRLWSFMASYSKANQATKEYMQDHDLDKWIKNSGVIHLRLTERNYVLTHYIGQLDKNFRLGISGLSEVSGSDMASFYLAQRITDISNFKYRRSTRGIMEMGPTGQTIWNLFVFTRGYAQRIVFQSEKLKQVFSKDATWEEARSGFNDIVKIVIAAVIFGSLWQSLTGRKKNPWEPVSTLFGWKPGGLFYGVVSDFATVMSDLILGYMPWSDEETKERSQAELPMKTVRVLTDLLPFYAQAIDILDVAFDKKGVDTQLFREIRSALDSNYTPDKQETLNRNLWEKLKKGILASETPDPDFFQKIQSDISDAEDQLGKEMPNGTIYTLNKFGNEVKNQTNNLPPALVTPEEGFSPLVMFYLECQDSWKPYYQLFSDKEKEAWRLSHPKEETMLIFWGKYNKSVYYKGSKESKEVRELLDIWVDQYGINPAMEPGANWGVVPE